MAQTFDHSEGRGYCQCLQGQGGSQGKNLGRASAGVQSDSEKAIVVGTPATVPVHTRVAPVGMGRMAGFEICFEGRPG